MTPSRAVILALMAALAAASEPAGRAAPGATAPLEFGDAFWRHWGDGRAELAGYELTFTRYGEKRQGVAVAIFVTETFSNALRVKSDPGRHAKSDEFPAIKLNLVRDFPTGIYDYNLMTSAFVALAEVNGRPSGSPTKISFSSQEWCGHVYSQLLFDRGAARHTLHSYFDGEADRTERLTLPNDAVSEDALLLWARGLAAPALAPGQSRDVPMVRSLLEARVRHRPVVVERARLTREALARRVTVPAGTFEAETYRVEVTGGRTWAIAVEKAAPHRVLSWETSSGESGRMIKSDRLSYWEMNGPTFTSAVRKLGLEPRPARTP